MHLPRFRLRADNAAGCRDELDESPERGGQARECPKCGGMGADGIRFFAEHVLKSAAYRPIGAEPVEQFLL